MRIIGLTGGIASGKSTVSTVLRDFGAHIIDADQIAREIVKPGSPALDDISRDFGRDVLTPGGELDRKKMAGIVFASEQALKRLDKITHPRIRKEITRQLEEIRLQEKDGKKEAVAVVDAPLLIEAGMTDLVDEVWLLVLPEKIQIARLMERDHLTREEAEKRIRSQMPLAEKIPYAAEKIDTAGTLADTVRQVEAAWYKTFFRHSITDR